MLDSTKPQNTILEDLTVYTGIKLLIRKLLSDMVKASISS